MGLYCAYHLISFCVCVFSAKNSNSEIKLTQEKKSQNFLGSQSFWWYFTSKHTRYFLFLPSPLLGPLQIFHSLLVALKQVSAGGSFCPSPPLVHLKWIQGRKEKLIEEKTERPPDRDNCKLQARIRSQKGQRMRPPTTGVKTAQGRC